MKLLGQAIQNILPELKKNMKIALAVEVRGQGQMSSTSKHF